MCHCLLVFSVRLVLVVSSVTIAANEKVLAKCGRKMNFSSVFNQTKPMLFQIDKITEKNNMKSSGESKFYKFNAEFKPAFCQYNVARSTFSLFLFKFQKFFQINSIFQVSNSQIFNKIYFSVIFNKVFVNIFDFSGEF